MRKKSDFSLISGENKLFSLLEFCELEELLRLGDTVQKPVYL